MSEQNKVKNKKESVKMAVNASLVEQLSKEKAELCKKVNSLECQLKSALVDKNKLSQIEYLVKDKAELSKKVNALESQLRVAEQERDRSNRNEAVALDRIKDLQDDLKRKQEDVDDSKKRISILEAKIIELETTMATMRSSKDAIMNCKSFLDQAVNLFKTATLGDGKTASSSNPETLRLLQA